MNNLFKNGSLDVSIIVHGETDTYNVRIIFDNLLDPIRNEIKRNGDQISLRTIIRAIVSAFNTGDIKVRCDCADFRYRQSYWLSVNGAIAGDPETRPSDITNPNDTKGSGCKHIQMVLSRNVWIDKVSAVIYNYINYMEKHYESLYAQIIYPALYGKEYEEPYQIDIDDISGDERDLDSTEDEIDTSNKWARTKNQFKAGNEYRFRPDDQIPGQKSFDFDSLMSDS